MNPWNIVEQISEFKSSSSSYDSDSNSCNSSSFSSSSSDFMEDASSSPSSPNGPLFRFSSDLMDQLPIKRGLSKYYKGKCESFASLASVEKLEDLPKRENPYKIKSRSRNCRNKLDVEKLTMMSPKPTISKKSNKRSPRNPPLPLLH